jgi:AraC-like DNA-binding protein
MPLIEIAITLPPQRLREEIMVPDGEINPNAAAMAAAIGGASIGDHDRGLRATRLRIIRDDIERNLAGDVSAAALARRHGISARYLRKLFEREGTSLSRFVLARRLTAVHRMLSSRQHAHLPISSLAYDAGFGDLSTFNRAFRARFGATPPDIRSLAGTQLI